jgi:hypothetical protein
MGWAFAECGRYHLLLRRRRRLDLADPVVTDRYRLYAVGWVFWWSGLEMLTDPVGAPLLGLLGASSAVYIWLAFLPPRAYLARVRAQAAATS